MIFVTGDTHIPIDIGKLSSKKWEQGNSLTKNDFLIILGDFGLLWNNAPDKEEIYWKNWLDNKPWTTLFISGNHENHDRIAQLEEIQMFGNIVGKVSDSIFHLQTGRIYTIDGKEFFCFGGAESTDKHLRIEGKNWWSQETATMEEINRALDSLENKSFVDIILTHTLPNDLVPFWRKTKCPTSSFLQHIFETMNWNNWFCGHFHMNEKFEIVGVEILYNNIKEIK